MTCFSRSCLSEIAFHVVSIQDTCAVAECFMFRNICKGFPTWIDNFHIVRDLDWSCQRSTEVNDLRWAHITFLEFTYILDSFQCWIRIWQLFIILRCFYPTLVGYLWFFTHFRCVEFLVNNMTSSQRSQNEPEPKNQVPSTSSRH